MTIQENGRHELLMVDTGCDLPYLDYFTNDSIGFMPFLLKSNTKETLDTRDEVHILSNYKKNLFSIRRNITSTSPGVDVIKRSILSYLKKSIENGFSPETLHIQQADMVRAFASKETIFRVYSEFADETSSFYNELIKITGNPNFSLKIYDTKQFFTGQALIALYTIELLNKNIEKREIPQKINNFIPEVETYVIPRELSYLRKRAKEKGDRSIRKHQEVFSKIMNIIPIILIKNSDTRVHTTKRFQYNGLKSIITELNHKLKNKVGPLLSSNICISYAGDLESFHKKFKKELAILHIIAIRNKLNVIFSTASSAAGINIGPKSIFVSYAI